MAWPPDGEKISKISLFWRNSRTWQTDGHRMPAIAALMHSIARQKRLQCVHKVSAISPVYTYNMTPVIRPKANEANLPPLHILPTSLPRHCPALKDLARLPTELFAYRPSLDRYFQMSIWFYRCTLDWWQKHYSLLDPKSCGNPQ